MRLPIYDIGIVSLEEPRKYECETCMGDGFIYFDSDGQDISDIEYEKGIKDGLDVFKEICEKCNGDGYIYR